MVGLSAGTAMTAADAALPTSHPPTRNPTSTIPEARSRDGRDSSHDALRAARRLADHRHHHETVRESAPASAPKFDSSNEVVASCIVQEPSERAHGVARTEVLPESETGKNARPARISSRHQSATTF